MDGAKDREYVMMETLPPSSNPNCVFLTDPVFLIDRRNCRFIKSEPRTTVLVSKETNLPQDMVTNFGTCKQSPVISKEMPMDNIIKYNTPLSIIPLPCAVCQNVCINCKSMCVTCKTPCRTCNDSCNPPLSTYTDTNDFEKYLESLNRKVKVPPKVKTVGTDTCDLDAHFDYYKHENKEKIHTKTVATDCLGLNPQKAVEKKQAKAVAVSTRDYLDQGRDVWPELPFGDLKNATAAVNLNDETDDFNDFLVIDEKQESEDEVVVNNVAEKAVGERCVRRLTMLSVSSSDESDVDLKTASNYLRSKSIVKQHEMVLNEIKSDTEIKYECGVCKAELSTKKDGVVHLASHVTDTGYTCHKCDFVIQFDSRSSTFSLHLLGRHCKNHYNSEAMRCNICNKRFYSKSRLVNHKLLHKRKGLECEMCEQSPLFTSAGPLILHKRLHHGVDRLGRKRPKREFICLVCGKQFKSSKGLSDHTSVHTGEKKHLCDICNKSYSSTANLQIHKRTHTGQKNFKCNYCDKAFHKKDSLKVHFRKHSGERPFRCDICPMTFDRNYILKNHRLRHFSEKTYICPVCGKSFTTHGGLNKHEKSHRKNTEEKRPRKPAVKPTLDKANAVICDVCGKVYSTKSNLRLHKHIHLGLKPFKCPVCNLTYTKKDSMQTHMRKHTDERPFACNTCGLTFFRNHTLKTHQLRHTGEKPHKCDKCGKGFTQSSSLVYHIRHHDRPKKHNTNDVNTSPKKKRPPTTKTYNIIVHKSPLHLDVEGTDTKLSTNGEVNRRGHHFMLPVSDKYTNDKVLLQRNETSVCEAGKEIPNLVQSKCNYFLTKDGHLVPITRDSRSKTSFRSVGDMVEDHEELITDGLPIKEEEITIKAEEIGNSLLETKVVQHWHSAVAAPGDVLNATFVTQDPAEIIPFNSVTLQGFSAENLLMNPYSMKEDDKKKKSRAHVVNTNLRMKGGPVMTKSSKPLKDDHLTSDGVLNLKDSRITVISPPVVAPSLQIQGVQDVILHNISASYFGAVPSSH